MEIDEDGDDLGAPEITGNIVATLTRPQSEQSRAAARPADEIDLRKPVSIFSGLVTDAMADLADRGLLNGVVTAA